MFRPTLSICRHLLRTTAIACAVFASSSRPALAQAKGEPSPLVHPRVEQPRAVSWARASAMEYVARAARLQNEDRLLEALRWLGVAIQMDPSYGEAYLRLGALRELMGDYAEAELVYGRATRQSPTAVEAFAARAELRRRLGRPMEATRDLEESIARDPAAQPARLEKLATWYVERRSWPAALAVWRRLLVTSKAPEEAERARIQVLALMALSGTTDVLALSDDGGWIRTALEKIAERAEAVRP